MGAGAHIPNCSVCFEELGKYGGPASLPCGHNGCLQCMAHVQRNKPECPICRRPFGQGLHLVVNYELRDLMQLATALTTVERDEGWETVTSTRLLYKEGTSDAEDANNVALVPSAPPLHVDLRSVLEGAGDLMSLEPPKWVPDSSAGSCTSCHKSFSFLVRSRHHCRVCGDLFCANCTSGRMLVPPKFLRHEPQRVCASCGELLAPLQPLLAGTVSQAVQAPVHDTTDWSVWRSLLNSPISRRLEDDIFKSVNILRHFSSIGMVKPERGIPKAVLANCFGLAIFSMLRVGAGWSCALGTGLVVARRQDGTWSAPSSVLSVSAGAGWQLGAELTDVVVVLQNLAAVRAFCVSQLGLGGSASIAAGPLGREASAKLQLSTSGGALSYSYSCSRGAYVGISLEGALIRSRDAVNQMFYGRPVSAKELLTSTSHHQPAAAAVLYDAMDDLLAEIEAIAGSSNQFSVNSSEQRVPHSLCPQPHHHQVWLDEDYGRRSGNCAASNTQLHANSEIHVEPPSCPLFHEAFQEVPSLEEEAPVVRDDVQGALPLWHSPSIPAPFVNLEDGQDLPSLFD